ncbi:hypothetical protein JOM56_009745 [Amanita muscaria]
MLHNGYYYNPYLHDLETLARERERSEALAARRARRAQYLPLEDVDSDEEDLYSPPSQRESMYLEARRRQETLERLATERRMGETEAFRRRMEQGAVEKEKMQTFQRSPSQKRSVPINMSRSSPRRPNNVTPPQTPIPVVEYTQAQHDAAERIQKWYQRYRALKTINDVAAQFEQTKDALVFPDSLDFVNPDKPGDVITIPVVLALEGAHGDVVTEVVDNHPVALLTTDQPSEDTVTETTSSSFIPESLDYDVVETTPSPSEDASPSSQFDSQNERSALQLAYTKRNYPVRAYTENLNVLLMKLDSVQSYGSRKVRERRKEVAQMIEKEAARIENVERYVEELGEGESAAVMDA